MPSAAIATGCADHVLPLKRIADALVARTMWSGSTDLLRVPPVLGLGNPLTHWYNDS